MIHIYFIAHLMTPSDGAHLLRSISIRHRCTQERNIPQRMIRDGMQKTPDNVAGMKYLFQLAKRINKKLINGVDDSNGTIWPLIQDATGRIVDYACKHPEDKEIEEIIRSGAAWDSGFDFEEPFKQLLTD